MAVDERAAKRGLISFVVGTVLCVTGVVGLLNEIPNPVSLNSYEHQEISRMEEKQDMTAIYFGGLAALGLSIVLGSTLYVGRKTGF